MQVVDEFGDAAVEAAGDGDVVEDRQVLHELAQPDPAGVRADRNAELLRHEVHGKNLVDAAESRRVELAVVDRLGLEHLLEEHAVHAVLAGGDADRRHRLADRGVTEHVVRARRLLDPERLELGELADPLDRLRHVPDLVRVDHEVGVPADHLASDGEASVVVRAIGADLELDVAVALIHGLPKKAAELFVAVAEPAGARGVAGVAGFGELGDAVTARRRQLGEHRDGLVARDRVREVPEVGRVHELLRRHVDEQPPQRLAGDPRREIPHRVHHRREGEVHDALLRPEPAQLRVALELPVNGPEVRHRVLDGLADERDSALAGRFDAEVVAPPDRKRESVALELRIVGVDHDVSGGVVAVLVHRIRAVHAQGGGKPHVVRGHCGDGGHRCLPVRNEVGRSPAERRSLQSSSGIGVR